MSFYPYNPNMGQGIQTDIEDVEVDRGFLAHFQVAATVAATCEVKAASDDDDTLTISGTAALGERVNDLSVLLTTAEDDTLAVSGDDETGVITIALADTTATKNTAALIETAIQALSTVAGINVSAFTCETDGDWDTAAKATGETEAVSFTGGISDAEAADTDGVHAAYACTTPYVAATCTVEADSAETDTLTVNALPVTIGADANALSISLETAEDDNLAVTADGAVITIELADTTATKNTASLIQAAIRNLETVNDINVESFTCDASGDWDTAAIATGETEAVEFTGGQDAEADVLTTDITNPYVPRNITATAGGTAADIKAVQVTITGTNYADEEITEDLPAFTVNTAGTVEGSKAFKTITSISIPAHDDTEATTAIGWGDKLGLPYKKAHIPCIAAYLDDALEGTAPTIAVSATALESNTIELNSSLDGSVVDAYLIV